MTPSLPRNMKDRRGEQHGMLTIERYVGRTPAGAPVWECRCECGTLKPISATHLGKGSTTHKYKTVSCGCYRNSIFARFNRDKPSPARKPPGVAALRNRFLSYTRDATRRGLSWELEEPFVLRLFQSPCHYCGVPPGQVTSSGGSRRYGTTALYNGIDRKDNDAGYTPANVVPCCGLCNTCKGTLSYEAFLEWIARAYQHLGQSPGFPPTARV